MDNGSENKIKKSFTDAIRFYKNGKSILKPAQIEYGIFKDAKPVDEACEILILRS